MNRTAICIKLLLKLFSVEKMNRVELANYLECNERNVREYVMELRTAGYDIESIRGVDGGYRLNKKEFFPQLNFSKQELEALQNGLDYLQKRSDFINQEGFSLAISKILANSWGNDVSFDNVKIVEKYPLVMPMSELRNRYVLINCAISEHKKIEVVYQAVSKTMNKQYVLHPYTCLIFNNCWYVIAWNEMLRDVDPIGIYKLNRFEQITIKEEKFVESKTFDEKKYINQFSFQMDKKIKVKIEFKDVNMAIKERIYGANQELTEINPHTIILECYMNEFDAMTLALSYGDNAKVLQPESLVIRVKEKLQNSLNQYI